MNVPTPSFESIPEQDEFLARFPHRFNYIWAEHPDPGDRPEWKTESRHPLSDRQIQHGKHLYGVRFGKQTRYVMLDVDSSSPYHPDQDPFAIHRILAALEPLGLVEAVSVSSSYRNGIHLYLPFPKPQDSWAIARVVSTLIGNAGFKLNPGQLEVFPNPRP